MNKKVGKEKKCLLGLLMYLWSLHGHTHIIMSYKCLRFHRCEKIYIYISIYKYTHIYIYIHTHIYIYTHSNTYIYIHTY